MRSVFMVFGFGMMLVGCDSPVLEPDGPSAVTARSIEDDQAYVDSMMSLLGISQASSLAVVGYSSLGLDGYVEATTLLPSFPIPGRIEHHMDWDWEADGTTGSHSVVDDGTWAGPRWDLESRFEVPVDCDGLSMSGLIDLRVTHYASWVVSAPYLGDVGINGQPVATGDDSSCVFEGDDEGGPGGSGGGGWDPELPCFLEITIDWFDGDGNYVGSTTHYLETTCPDDPL